MRPMVSSQGSIPPSFISFRLENQPPETETLPDVYSQSQSSTTGNTVPEPQIPVGTLYCPQSATNQVDVNAYAEGKVQHMETERMSSQEEQAVVETQ